MASVAFIGPDGTGKTTLTRRIAESGFFPCRYLYMGVNIYATNMALPTVRMAGFLKKWVSPPPRVSVQAAPASGRRRKARIPGWLWATARLGNHLADEWFRQLVSWYYQARGFVVLYDRHFVFDFSPEIVEGMPAGPDRRLHLWLVNHLYPRPDIVFFLDAPGEVLFARKGESTVAELERRRQCFARLGARVPRFIRIDATRTQDEVYAEILRHLGKEFGFQPPVPAPVTVPLSSLPTTAGSGT